jgi:hypothetical protein
MIYFWSMLSGEFKIFTVQGLPSITMIINKLSR